MSERFKGRSMHDLQVGIDELVTKRANEAGEFSCVDSKLFKAMTTELSYRKRYGDIYRSPTIEVEVSDPVVEVEVNDVPQEIEIELNRVTFYKDNK